MNDTYYTLEEMSHGLYKDKGSRFIAQAYPVTDEEQIRAILAEIKKTYYDARHHCYAWQLGQDEVSYRVNDDGEPSGTAGKPIHGQILSAGITDVLIVVVRYFGGTKLGVRGLIDAYKGAAQDAIAQAKIIQKVREKRFRVVFDYVSMHDVMKIIKDNHLDTSEQTFHLRCSLVLTVRKAIAPQILEQLSTISGTEVHEVI